MRRPTLASLHLSTNLYNFWNGLFFLVNKKYASTTPKRPWSHYVSVATPFGRAKLVSLTKVPFGMSLRLKLGIFILILVRRHNVSDRNKTFFFNIFFNSIFWGKFVTKICCSPHWPTFTIDKETFSSVDYNFDIFFHYFYLASFLTNLVRQYHVLKTD